MHWIIGTAGHIDHGKTRLIRALTGQDTDRLPEEKARGISIDLGFASLDLPDGSRAGIIDVPGHERFIRNMLAGAHGIDLVLFTVAADDGVMPQTEEHLDILHLLGITRAIFVITKADLVSPGRITEVGQAVRLLIAGTSLESSPTLPFSATSGEGLPELRGLIADRLSAAARAQSDGYFRLPVDRAFASAGHGLVVTGTAINGEIRSGDKVRRLPGDDMLRVRSVEVHNEPVDVARRGQRVALNLSGTLRAPVERGDVIVHEAITLTSDRFDARIEVRPSAASGLKDHQRVRVHLGTAERLGTVILLDRHELADRGVVPPGVTALCQVTVVQPLSAMKGDRFILRDETARRTIAGGVVLLAAALRHKRSDPGLVARLAAIERGDDGSALVGALIRERGGFVISLTTLAQFLNRTEDVVRSWLENASGVHAFKIDGAVDYASEERCRLAKTSLLGALKDWHSTHPLAAGIDLEEARAGLPNAIPAKIFRALVQELEHEALVVREGNLLRLPDHRVTVPDASAGLVEQITTLLGATPLAPPNLKQLGDTLAVDRRRLAELMRAMERQQSIVCVAPDLYFLTGCVDRLRTELVRHLSAQQGITTGEFRDHYKTSRKYAIPLLEYFDREGLTIRIGEMRRLRHAPTELT